jgi:hypothetical protein
MLTLDELMQKVATLLNPEEIVDLLGLSSEDLVEAFHEKIADHYDRIVSAIDGSDENTYIEGYDYYV